MMHSQATDELFDRLLAEPEQALHDRWEAVTRELRALEEEERALAERRSRLDARRAVLSGIAQLRQVELADGDRGTTNRTEAPMRTRDVAIEIITGQPNRTWSAQTLHDALAERGVQTSRSNVRVVLQRLLDDGHVNRVAYGRYQSARPPAGTPAGPNGGEGT
jgi:hypothetical protein